MLFGQVYTNKRAISSHYNADPKLFLSFLDPIFPAYSQGVYENDDETLSTALQRKFDWALEQCGIGKGTRVLEIGPGWGAFAGHALQAGARFTGITNSEVSQTYLKGKLANFGDRFDIVLTDFYEYEPKEKFDAIVIMGVIEHLPDYERVLKKFSALLKPGGRVFLDGSAWKKKYELSTFMVRHIYPGNHSFLVLDDFLNKLGRPTSRWTSSTTTAGAISLPSGNGRGTSMPAGTTSRAPSAISSSASSGFIYGGRLTSSSTAISIATG